MNRCSIVLAALLAVPAGAEEDGAAEQVKGQSLIGQGRLAEAEAALRRGDHPALIRLMQALADCYRLRGRTGDAEALYESARRISDRAYGRRHAAILPSLSGLALAAQQRGDEARAESLHRDALAVAEDALGPDDPARAELLGNLASFYARQGQPGTAEHLYVRALAALEHVEERDPRRTAVLHDLAAFYATQGRRAEAARIERALGAPRAMLSRRASPVPPAEEP